MLAIPQPGDGHAELLLELIDGGIEIFMLGAEVHLAATDVDRNRSGVSLILVANVLGSEGEAQDGALGEVLQALPEGLGEFLVGVVLDGGCELETDGCHDNVQGVSPRRVVWITHPLKYLTTHTLYSQL